MTEAMHMHRVFDEVEAGDIVTDVQLDKCLDVLGLARGDSGGAVTITGADPAVDSPHRLGVCRT